MNLIIAWILAFIVAQAPPNRPQFLPDAKETVPEATARYESIAKDIAEVVFDASETPLFKGQNGRIKTAAVIQSIMLHESGFRKDVDLGRGKQAVGDGGKSWCMMQVQLGVVKANGKTQQRIVLESEGTFHFVFDGVSGLGGEDLVKDRKNCIRAGLHIMRRSFAACSRLPAIQLLNAYASGSCDKGQESSERRMGLALRWFKAHKPDFTDADVLAAPLEPMPLSEPVPPTVASPVLSFNQTLAKSVGN